MTARTYNVFSYPAGFAPGYDQTHLASTQNLRFSCVAMAVKQVRQIYPNYGVAASIAANSQFGMDAYVGPCIMPWAYSECRFDRAIQDRTGTCAAILLGPSVYDFAAAGSSSIISDSEFASGGVRLNWQNSDGLLFGDEPSGGAPYVWTPANVITIPLRQPFFVAMCYRESGPACFVLRNLLTGALRAEPSSANGGAIGSNAAAMSYCLGGQRFNAEGGDEKYNCAMWSGDYLGMEALVKWSEDPWAFWYPRGSRIRRQKGGAIIFQILRPDADGSISDWTDQGGGTTTIFNSIDESSASDADFVRSPGPPNSSVARFRLSDPTTGKILTAPVVVAYRFRKTSPTNQTLVVSLKQGTTLIASWSHTGAGLTETYQTVEQTLTTPQFASISDLNDLFIEFQAS